MSMIIKRIEAAFRLPYLIALPEGEYPISPRRRLLYLTHPQALRYVIEGREVLLSCENHSVIRTFHKIDEDEAILKR